MSKEFMKLYHMPFKAQEIKQDDNSTNFRLQMDQAFEEMTKSFAKQQDEMIINYLYKKYKDTKVSDVWVLSKPDFEKFLLEMLPKWKGKDLKGANYDNIIIDESIDNANPSEALEKLDDISYLVLNEIDDLKNKELWKSYFTTIKQALLKAQEQEKENELLKGQMKYVTVVITEFQKILRTIKEKCLTNCNLALVKDNLHYQNYCKEFEYFLNKYNESPNGFEIIKEDLLTKEEFNLLKEVLE